MASTSSRGGRNATKGVTPVGGRPIFCLTVINLAIYLFNINSQPNGSATPPGSKRNPRSEPRIMAKANHTPPVIPLVAARRGILLGALMALAAPKALRAEPVTAECIDAAAKTLAEALASLHGERWSVKVEHDNGLVLMLRGGAK